VDLPEGKNLVGAFVRPRLVAADLQWLDTLSEPEISNGLAEIIKMGLLSGGGYFSDLGLIPSARERDLDALQKLVLHSVRYKAHIVAGDEKEGGLRAILNYGHTVGHGLEAAANYNLPHGSAVAAGMVAAATLAMDRFGVDLVGAHEDFIAAAGLPRRVPGVDVDRALEAMARDKKRTAKDGPGGYRFVLLEDFGKPIKNVPVSEEEARGAIGAIVG
jgi:3-dehydroquinate synthase